MITLKMSLSNPWSDRWDNLFDWHMLLTENKVLEIQITKNNTVVNFALQIRFQEDHHGFQMQLGLMGYEIDFHQYDTRHW